MNDKLHFHIFYKAFIEENTHWMSYYIKSPTSNCPKTLELEKMFSHLLNAMLKLLSDQESFMTNPVSFYALIARKLLLN